MDDIETKLAWLAGIVDGEGYVAVRMLDGIKKHPNPKRARRGLSKAIYCYLKIESVSISMITAVALILDKINVNYNIGKPRMMPKSTLPAIRLEVGKKRELLRLCDFILPYCIVKKQELELVKSYLVKSVAYKYYRMSKSDLKISDNMRKLHDINGKKGRRPDFLAAKSKSNIGQDNAELKQEQNSCKCVEHIEVATQKELWVDEMCRTSAKAE